MPLLKCDDKEIVYGTAAGARWGAGILGAVMLAISSGIPVLLWTTRSKYIGQSPLVLAGPISFGLFMPMLGLMILLFFLINEDLILDLTTRTYRYRSGLPLLTRWQTGPFRDIEDIVLRKVAAKQGTAYRLALVWHNTAQGFWRSLLRDLREFVLDQSGAKPQAEAESEMRLVAQHLALPGITGHYEPSEPVRQRSLRMTIFGTLVGALAIVGIFGPQLLVAMQLNTQGRTVRGVITRDWPVKNGVHVEFTYPANGQTLEGFDTVTLGDRQAVNVGGPIEITYLPDYPNTGRAHNSNDSLAGSVQIFCVLGIPLLLVSLFFLYRFRPQSGDKLSSY